MIHEVMVRGLGVAVRAGIAMPLRMAIT
jgi:hypothetical protein